MTSGANRLKANLNRSFGARRNKKSALIKNYESIVVPPFERTTKPTRNKNRTKRHISTNVTTTNTAPPPAITVNKEEDNTTSKRKIIRNGNKQHNFGMDVTSQHNELPFNNMLMSNQQHDNTNMPMTRRQQQNDSLFNTDSIERFVNQQESQSAKKRQHQMQEIVIRERAIQREMKEVALMKQQHMNLNSNQHQQQRPMMMGLGSRGGGLDFNTHNSYQNTQKKSSFNFDFDTMNNTNVGNGGGLDILRNDESGGGNGLSRFRIQPSNKLDDDDDEASTSQAIQQQEEPNDNSTHEVLTTPLNDSRPAQLKPLPIRYFNNGVEVNMQGSPLSSITSQSNLLNESAVGGGIQVDGHHVHHTQQKGMEEEKMPSKKQPPIQQPIGMPNAMPQHMMVPQPQLMKQNTNYQMPNNQMTTTGVADDTSTTKEPLNNEMNQSTLPEPSAKLPHKEEDDMPPTKAQRKAKKKAAKKEKRKRSSTQQQNRLSKAQKIDKPKIEESSHHQEVVNKDEPNKLDSNTVQIANTNDAADRMPTKAANKLPSLTDKGCTSERSLSAEKKSTTAHQKMPKSTDDNCNTTNQSSSAASSSTVNAEFRPKLSTHVSRGPHGDVLDQLFGGL